ncbi:MAG: hypothetical protein B7C24_13505 [Bacteroidetes bacterium 4572_77]|nr:MAG: hypothetical protein B7C24_13505 [Bacteroidetes bacterium 4572_77]
MKARELTVFKTLIAISSIYIPLSFLLISSKIILILLVIFLITSIFFVLFKKNSLAFYTVCFAIACILSFSATADKIKYDSKVIQPQKAVFHGEIVKILKQKEKFVRVIAEGNLNTKALPDLKKQRILLTITKDSSNHKKFYAGEKFNAKIHVELPINSQLPNEFSMSRYCRTIDCDWVGIVNIKKYAFLGLNKNFYYYQQFYSNKVNQIIDIYYDEPEKAIVEALVLGKKTNIDKTSKKEFSRSGAAHLLAISGLHTGLIAAFVFIILGFIRNHTVKFIVFTILLSTFIVISGMQTSAIRAAFMIELYLFAKLISRKTIALNIVSTVLLVYIIANPKIIYNISYQMSALSVLGIIILYPYIVKLWANLKIAEHIPKYIKNSLSITCAASIAVSPLVAVYFGTFSIISPLVNLIQIPIFTLILAFSFLSIFFSLIPFIASLYSAASILLIKIANTINHFAVSLPYSYIDNDLVIYIAICVSVVSIYLILSSSKRQLVFRLLNGAVLGILLFLLLIPFQQDEKIKIYPRQQMVVVDYPKKDNEKMLLMIDRKDWGYAKRDMGLEQYIKTESEKCDTVIIGYNGKTGDSLISRLKDSINIKTVKLDIKQQSRIAKLLNLKQHLVQIIDK